MHATRSDQSKGAFTSTMLHIGEGKKLLQEHNTNVTACSSCKLLVAQAPVVRVSTERHVVKCDENNGKTLFAHTAELTNNCTIEVSQLHRKKIATITILNINMTITTSV